MVLMTGSSGEEKKEEAVKRGNLKGLAWVRRGATLTVTWAWASRPGGGSESERGVAAGNLNHHH
eukprot:112415-Rhodomonas_salina.1